MGRKSPRARRVTKVRNCVLSLSRRIMLLTNSNRRGTYLERTALSGLPLLSHRKPCQHSCEKSDKRLQQGRGGGESTSGRAAASTKDSPDSGTAAQPVSVLRPQLEAVCWILDIYGDRSALSPSRPQRGHGRPGPMNVHQV
jgi:hypothetical protein